MVRIERRRVQRSQMLLDTDVLFRILPMDTALRTMIGALSTSTREADLVGWYDTGSTLGIIFADLNADKSFTAEHHGPLFPRDPRPLPS
jgi:hypothetical protein